MQRGLKYKLSVAALALIVILLLFPSPAFSQIPKGPWIDTLILFPMAEEDKVVSLIEGGKMHIWLYNLRKLENIKAAVESPKVKLLKTYGGAYDIFVNPVKTKTGFNPFTMREVREALNYIVDREYVSKEILKGYAIPRWTVFRTVSPDYARNVDFMKSLELKYAYNFEKGKKMIADALTKAGAVLKGGKWYYNGKPIVLKFFIRIEDYRRDIGDYVASQLEKVGFTIEKLYRPARDAVPIVYGGDPTEGRWHLYTEGWAFTAITAYDDTDPDFFCTSPYSGAVFNVYKPPKELVEVAKKLSAAKYTSFEERNELVRKATELALKDSVRIWLVDQITPFAYSADIEQMVYDLYGGVFSPLALRSIKFKGKVGGVAKAGNRVMFTSAYNPVGGFKWLYDVFVYYAISDPALITHPHTGRYIPLRAKFEVRTAGPKGVLRVPPTALKYDVAEKKWVPVGPNVTATSAVRFIFTLGKWHDGQPVTISDILMSLATTFEVATPNSTLYDPACVTPTTETFVKNFKGLSIIGGNVYEVYIDYWHPDPSYIADVAAIGATVPWEVQALMNAAVADRKLAFSDTKAEEWKVDYLDLTKGHSLDVLKSYLEKFKEESFIPPEISQYVSPEEAKMRWKAISDWFAEHGHFYVSNGPFYIDRVDTVAKQVIMKAFREYPFRADRWAFLIKPKVPVITVAGPSEAAMGSSVVFNVTSTFEGRPYTRVKVKYLLLSPEGAVVFKGDAKSVGMGLFSIELSPEETAKLKPGAYTLMVIAVGEEAATPVIKTLSLVVIPG